MILEQRMPLVLGGKVCASLDGQLGVWTMCVDDGGRQHGLVICGEVVPKLRTGHGTAHNGRGRHDHDAVVASGRPWGESLAQDTYRRILGSLVGLQHTDPKQSEADILCK